MDVRVIGARLGKAAAAAQPSRTWWQTLKDLEQIRLNTASLGLYDRLGLTDTKAIQGGSRAVDMAKQLSRGTLGTASRIANGVAFGIPDWIGLTNSKQHQGKGYAAAEIGGVLGSLFIPGGVVVQGLRGAGYAGRGLGLLRALRAARMARAAGAGTKVVNAATGGSKVLSTIRGLLRTRNAATAVRAAAPAVRAGKASPALSKVYAVLRGLGGRNLTAVQRAQIEARWAARNSLKSWTDSAHMAVGMVGGGGATTKGVTTVAAGGSKALSTIRGLLRARNAAPAVRAAAPAVPSVARTTASLIGYSAFPRPVAMASMTLRLPSVLGKHVVAPTVRGTGRLIGRIPGVRGAISRIAATRGGQTLSHGGRVLRASGHQFMRNRPMTALSRAAKFVEGRGGLGSKAFMAADAAVPMYAGIKYFDPESEAMARALGYDSQFVADVSTTPGSFVPAARIQPPLYNTIPGMVNERRMRKWVDQYGRDIQALTDEQTAASRKLLSRRY